MTPLSNSEYAAKVLELAGAAGQFRPTAYYDPDGDCIEFLARPDNYHGERLDDLVTVYVSEETGEVIGSLLSGVTPFCRKLLERLPGFQIEIQQGKVKLVHIFLARLWASDAAQGRLATVTYQKLIDVAGQTGVEVELNAAA
jgi:hypothetical protein